MFCFHFTLHEGHGTSIGHKLLPWGDNSSGCFFVLLISETRDPGKFKHLPWSHTTLGVLFLDFTIL